MKTVGKIVLGGVILMVLAVGGCFALVGGVANEVDKSMKEDAKTVTTVKYEVDADGSSVGDVTYSKSGSGQTAQENGAKLPWSKTVKIKGDPTLDTYTVLAQNQYSGKISCKISVDGKVVNENESSGQYALVDCTYTQDLDE